MGEGVGGGGLGEGHKTFYPPSHTLHYHMVLCPEGTSHNERFVAPRIGLCLWSAAHGASTAHNPTPNASSVKQVHPAPPIGRNRAQCT